MNRALSNGLVPPAHRIRDLPARLRPREEFDRLGAEHVSDRVLLAVLLGSGSAGINVAELAERLLIKYGSFLGLARANLDELARDPDLPGVGRVKARILKAAFELARRLAEETREAEGNYVRSPEDAARVLRETAKPLQHERFWVLPLDAKNRLQGRVDELTRGILDASMVHPREVFKRAIAQGCSRLVLVHNHPTGDPTPSAEDLRITRQLVAAGRVLGIEVLERM